PTTAGDFDLRSRADEISDDLAVQGLHDRAIRHPEHRVPPVSAVTVATGAALAVLSLHVRAEVEIEQRVHLGVDNQRDAPAMSAMAAVRAAQRLELLAANRDAAVATVTGLQMQDNPVYEHGHDIILPTHPARHDPATAIPARPARR